MTEEQKPQVEIVETQAHSVHGLAMVDPKGSLWVTFAQPWWNLASWFWYWLTPGKKAWVYVRRKDKKIRVRAVKIAKTCIQIGHVGKS